MIRVKTRNNFLPIYMAGQTNDYTEHVLSLQLPSEASGYLSLPLVQNVVCTSFSISKLFMYVGFL